MDELRKKQLDMLNEAVVQVLDVVRKYPALEPREKEHLEKTKQGLQQMVNKVNRKEHPERWDDPE